MNFFKSILSDEPDPPKPVKIHDSGPDSADDGAEETDDENDSDEISDEKPIAVSDGSTPGSAASVGGWSFGGLVKTLATRSESVLETYRRDLQEFGSGLRKETEIIREVASRAVKELPSSIEVGASVAHGSLESVSHAIDGVIKSTAGIISQGMEATAANAYSDVESDTPDTSKLSSSGRYSRFDAQLNAIQSDMNTFVEDPEDSEDYKNWKSGFILADKGEEIANLIGENGALEGVYSKVVVPNVVDKETFWCRYFYRVHKLQLQESKRASLVKRAISVDDDEELSWDVDDDEDDNENVKSKGDEVEKRAVSASNAESANDKSQSSNSASGNASGSDASTVEHAKKGDQTVQSSESNESSKVSPPEEEKVEIVNDNSQVQNVEKVTEDEEKPSSSDAKGGDHGESGKDSDISVVSSQQSVHEEQDLEWDEIEDIGSGDEKKPTQGVSPNRADVRKRLSTADEDEELTWDIEDDD
ncbi:OLC1v1007410C1 [Oldenlandia corymbosa var. corymbosa]|uniref:OLC1v1007410C1 n=1 Tax=Oldenlandia corymbosa var. corymbosa TaxID=529605 RepID=A0AAV1DMC5_OLDCO|nr:OLC1v1007410C1 [Oldenlandia corymbosa var. corymbosa]